MLRKQVLSRVAPGALCLLALSCTIEVHNLGGFTPAARGVDEPVAYSLLIEPSALRGTFRSKTSFPNLNDYITESVRRYVESSGLFERVTVGGTADLILRIDLRNLVLERKNDGWGAALWAYGGISAAGAIGLMASPEPESRSYWPTYAVLAVASIVPAILLPHTIAEVELGVELLESYSRASLYSRVVHSSARSRRKPGFNEAMDEALNMALGEVFNSLTPLVRGLDLTPAGGAGVFLQDATRVAILDFEPIGVPMEEAATITELFRSALFNTRRFMVVERSRMDAIFEEKGFMVTVCTDIECAVIVGKLLGVEVIFLGNLSRLGEKYIVSVRGVDVSDARVVLNEVVEHVGGVEGLTEAVNRLARRVAGQAAVH